MINLIKNELTKIFHKKAIYILMILAVLFLVFQTFMLRSIANENNDYYSTIEKTISNYDLKEYEDRKWYISEKTELDAWNNAKKYDSDSWQYYMIMNNTEDLFCQNEAIYETKNQEEAEKCRNNYEDFLEKIEKYDWSYFVTIDKEDKTRELNILKSELSNIEEERERYDLEKNIKTLEYEIEGLNYRLEKKMPPTNSKSSRLVEIYVGNAISLLDYPNDDGEYQNESKLAEKRELENQMKVAKYKLDNDIPATEYPDALDVISEEFSYIILFILIVTIMISGSIVADEYSKGTIKQLLLRPYSRTKILLSKYIAAVITFFIFAIFYYIADIISAGIAVGFDTINVPLIVYNFATKTIEEVSLFKYCFAHILALIPEYLIILTISFATSTIVGSGAVSIAVGFMSLIVSNIVNSLAINYSIKLLRFFPTMCWDFTPYLYGGTPAYKYSNMTVSIIICIVTLLVLLSGTIIYFKNKNIKNQ